MSESKRHYLWFIIVRLLWGTTTNEKELSKTKHSEDAAGQLNVYSERVSNEIKREHQQRLSWDDSLDLKCGVLLGFVILILVQVILSGELTTSLAGNIATLSPFTNAGVGVRLTGQVWISLISLVTFLLGFLCVFCAAIVGFRAFLLRRYADVTISVPENPHRDLVALYRSGKITSEELDTSVSDKLLEATSANVKNALEKVARIKTMLKFLIVGVILFAAHFFATLLFTVISS